MRIIKRAALAVMLALACSHGPALATDRVQWLYGMNPPSSWWNWMQRFDRLGNGTTLAMLLGNTNGFYYNLTVNAGTGLYVFVAPTHGNSIGAVFQYLPEESSAYGGPGVTALPTDATQAFLQGQISAPTPTIGPLTAPTTTGQTTDYLVECQVQTVDTTSQTVTFVTASGVQSTASANRDRKDEGVCQSKAGTAAATGSQTVPTPDTGWVGIGYVAVPYGTTSVTGSMISAQPPFSGVATLNASGVLAQSQGGTGTTSIPSATCLGWTGSAFASSACGITTASQTWSNTQTFASAPVGPNGGTFLDTSGTSQTKAGNLGAAELMAGTAATGMIAGDASVARGASSGALFFGSGGGAYIDYGVSHSTAFTMTGATGGFYVPLGNISATNSVLANIFDASGNSASGMTGGDVRAGRSAATGVYDFGSGTTYRLDFGLANTGAFSFSGGGVIAPNLASTALSTVSLPSTYVGGDTVAQRNDHQGVVVMGGAGSAGGWDWNINNASQLSGKVVGGGYANVSAGTYTNASDRRWKKDIRDVPYGLDMVLRLQPRAFSWKSDGKHDLGFIAQEVKPLMPELVHQDRQGYYLMNYQGLIPVLTLAIQQLQREIMELWTAIAALVLLNLWVLYYVRSMRRGVE